MPWVFGGGEQQIEWPDDAVEHMINTMATFVEEKANIELGLKPNFYLVALESQHLDTPIVRHYRQLGAAPMFSPFVNAFRAADQSGQAKGRRSVLEAAFTLDIAAVQTTGRRHLPKLPGKKKGSTKKRSKTKKTTKSSTATTTKKRGRKPKQ